MIEKRIEALLRDARYIATGKRIVDLKESMPAGTDVTTKQAVAEVVELAKKAFALKQHMNSMPQIP